MLLACAVCRICCKCEAQWQEIEYRVKPLIIDGLPHLAVLLVNTDHAYRPGLCSENAEETRAVVNSLHSLQSREIDGAVVTSKSHQLQSLQEARTNN